MMSNSEFYSIGHQQAEWKQSQACGGQFFNGVFSSDPIGKKRFAIPYKNRYDFEFDGVRRKQISASFQQGARLVGIGLIDKPFERDRCVKDDLGHNHESLATAPTCLRL